MPEHKELYDHIRCGHDPPLFYPDDQSNPGFVPGAPQQLTQLVLGVTTNKYLVLILINIILLIMGMLVDDVSGNILSAAILLPIAQSVGIDPIHFAAISVTNLSLGNITPPCAPMLYLAGLIGGNLPLNEYIKPATVFMVFGALPVILAVTYVPEFALVLVNSLR